jgi:hypothetical protein
MLIVHPDLCLFYPTGQGLHLTKRISLTQDGRFSGRVSCQERFLIARWDISWQPRTVKVVRGISSVPKAFSLIRLELSNKIYLLCLLYPYSLPRSFSPCFDTTAPPCTLWPLAVTRYRDSLIGETLTAAAWRHRTLCGPAQMNGGMERAQSSGEGGGGNGFISLYLLSFIC